MEATVTVKGQTTIPKAYRERLGIPHGGKIQILQHSDGSLHILPLLPIEVLRPVRTWKKGQPAITIEEMDAGIAAAVAARDKRSKSR